MGLLTGRSGIWSILDWVICVWVRKGHKYQNSNYCLKCGLRNPAVWGFTRAKR